MSNLIKIEINLIWHSFQLETCSQIKSNCTFLEVKEQPQIDMGYILNPILKQSTPFDSAKIAINKWDACPMGTIIELTFPLNAFIKN